MKKFTFIAMTALLSAGAFAGDNTINVVGRAGWTYKDNDVAKTGTANSSSFNFDFLRTTFAGVVTPSVKYFATADFLGNTNSVDSVDGTSPFIDEAYLTKTFTNGTSLIVGKKAVLVGGREYDYLNFDRYTTSYFFNATPANQVGATLSRDFAEQTLMVQYFNGNKENGSATTGTNAQSKFGYAVGWYGSFKNGMIKPILAYTVVPEAGGANGGLTSLSTAATPAHRVNKGNDEYMAAGVQFNTPHNVMFEVDYNVLTEKDAAGTITSKKDLKTTSMVAQIKYNGIKVSPFAKYISDTRKNDSTKTNSRIAYDLGFEFKESKDDAIRYQVVYSGSSVKDNINTTETKSSPKSILVGLKFDAAVLK